MPGLRKMPVLLGLFITLISPLWAANQHESLDYLFKSGTEGYKCFRIPAIVKSNEGTLLAFAEGRRNGCSDTGSIDLVLKRSTPPYEGITVSRPVDIISISEKSED